MAHRGKVRPLPAAFKWSSKTSNCFNVFVYSSVVSTVSAAGIGRMTTIANLLTSTHNVLSSEKYSCLCFVSVLVEHYEHHLSVYKHSLRFAHSPVAEEFQRDTMYTIGVQLENKFGSLENQLDLLSRQLELLQKFVKHNFQQQFEDFVNGQEHFDVSYCCGSSTGDGRPEFPEAPGPTSVLSTNQQDEQWEDFVERKFQPSGYEEPEHSEFCYTQFVNAMGLSKVDSNEEVPPHLEISTPRRLEDSNLTFGATSTAANPSSSSNYSKKLYRKNPVEEGTQGNLHKRRCLKKLRKRRLNGDRTSSDSSLENVRESEEDAEDLLASGVTAPSSLSVDSNSSHDKLESDEGTMKSGDGFRTAKKTSFVRRESLRGTTPSGCSTLRRHEQNRRKEKRFKCSVCPKRFLTNSNLRDHELIHTNEKPFQCSYCDKYFRQKSTLRVHNLIHTNEKPHECSHCGKCFRLAAYLRVHELIHTGEKPHECSFCSKRFNDRRNLRRHERSHRPPQ